MSLSAHAHTEVLAEAAGVLRSQLRVQLERLAKLVAPGAATLEHRFLSRLQRLRFDPRQRKALAAITPGALAEIVARRESLADFLEQVEYHGRRLAKLNLPPGAVVEALGEYGVLLGRLLRTLPRAERANLRWALEQLQFSVIIGLNNAYYQVREAESRALSELFEAELKARTQGELMHRFLATLARYARADEGRLFLHDPDARCWQCAARFPSGRRRPGAAQRSTYGQRKALARPRYIERGGPGTELLLEAGWRERFASFWSIPLTGGNHPAGLLQFGFRKPYEWLPRELQLLTFAEQCLEAIEKLRLMEDLAVREAQLQRLAHQMLEIEEVERRRISRELHDEAGQSLLCLRLELELLENSVRGVSLELEGRLHEARGLVERTIVEIRRLISALSPDVLERLGLAAALRQLVRRFRERCPACVQAHFSHLAGLPKRLQIVVYRLIQECCSNVAKHSGATDVKISAASADEVLKLVVEDNGVGFRAEGGLSKHDSFGLAGMRQRVALLGGRFEIQSRPRRGTRIAIQLPLSNQEPASRRAGPSRRRARLA